MQCLLSSLCFCLHSGLSAPSPAAATAATTAATAAAAKSEEVHPKLAAAGWPSTGTYQQNESSFLRHLYTSIPDHPIFVPCPQLARIMAVLRQQQAGGLGGSSKLSPSHHGGIGGGGAKLPGADLLPHPGLAGSVADLHQKSLGPYSGLWSYLGHGFFWMAYILFTFLFIPRTY